MNNGRNVGDGNRRYVMAEPTLAASFPTEVWAALGGATTLIVGLVTVLWNRQNKDIQAHDEKLTSGQAAFVKIGETLVLIGEQLKALEKEDSYQGEELDRLELDIKSLTKQLTVLETEHKNCQGRLPK